MSLLIVSFFAGILTILAPCVLPLLPVILGASVEDSKDKWRPYIIIASLGFSIILFSIILKASTVFIGVDPIVWKVISGLILVVFGIITLFPRLWETISIKLKLQSKSNEALMESSHKKGVTGSVLVGMSLGPVFSSCSPTYGVILAVILPVSFFTGLINLFAYALGLGIMLLIIAILGQKVIKKLKWASDANGWFKKALGLLFLFIGISIMFGLDKTFEAFLIDQGYLDLSGFEQQILDKVEQ